MSLDFLHSNAHLEKLVLGFGLPASFVRSELGLLLASSFYNLRSLALNWREITESIGPNFKNLFKGLL